MITKLTPKEQSALACFLRHGDQKCARCNEGMQIAYRVRAQRRQASAGAANHPGLDRPQTAW